MKKIIIGFLITLGVAGFVTTALPNTASAADIWGACSEGVSGKACNSSERKDIGTSVVKTIVNFLLYLTGIICVIIIILGGMRMTTSGGGDGAVRGRKMIAGAVIGLIVAVFAYAIVNLVTKQI